MVLERLLDQPLDSLDMKYLIANIDLISPKIRLLQFPKTAIDIEDWTMGLFNDLYQIKNFYNSQWFPRNVKGCYAWNRPCQFFDYCTSRNANHIEQMLAFDEAIGEENKVDYWMEMDLEIAV
jgi:hypothetical protein